MVTLAVRGVIGRSFWIDNYANVHWGNKPCDNVMLVILNDDNTTGNLYLCRVFYVLTVIVISDYICTRVCFYTIVICTNGAILNMCPCLLFFNIF